MKLTKTFSLFGLLLSMFGSAQPAEASQIMNLAEQADQTSDLNFTENGRWCGFGGGGGGGTCI